MIFSLAPRSITGMFFAFRARWAASFSFSAAALAAEACASAINACICKQVSLLMHTLPEMRPPHMGDCRAAMQGASMHS